MKKENMRRIRECVFFFFYIVDCRREIVGTLSSQDGNAKEAFD